MSSNISDESLQNPPFTVHPNEHFPLHVVVDVTPILPGCSLSFEN